MFVCVGGGGCILPSLCVVGCNESDAILRDAVYEHLDWRWRRQGTVGELREGMWAALNRMWQAQNDEVWPENQDAMSCAHTRTYIILTQRCSERAHTQTHTHCHGKVGTSIRGQFDLFPPKQINVYVALFLRHTHTVPISWAFSDGDETKSSEPASGCPSLVVTARIGAIRQINLRDFCPTPTAEQGHRTLCPFTYFISEWRIHGSNMSAWADAL